MLNHRNQWQFWQEPHISDANESVSDWHIVLSGDR